jgi:extradiol dioxygenase family protein
VASRPEVLVPPILHLSIPVADLERSRRFYLDQLGCRAGRTTPGFADVFFFGCQLTLQVRPDEVGGPPGVRHFGVTLAGPTWDRLVASLQAAGVTVVSGPTTRHTGTPAEETKLAVADPDGHVIELKTYADPSAALSGSATPSGSAGSADGSAPGLR